MPTYTIACHQMAYPSVQYDISDWYDISDKYVISDR